MKNKDLWSFEIIDKIPDSIVSPHVFFHSSMIEAWMVTYAPIRRLTPIIIKGYSEGKEAFIPFVLWHKNWKNAFVKSIIPIGYSDYDYHDPILTGKLSDKSKRAFWEELIDFLKSNYTFDTFQCDGITNTMAIGDNWKRGEICPLLRLDNIHNDDELMAFFKTSLRGDIRRQIRRLSEMGELRYTEYDSWDKIPKNTFVQFMSQHSTRWPNAYKAPHFHENLLKIGLKAGVVHFSTLSVRNTEIAWHLGFSYNGRYYYYMPAGNQDYFKFSPTKIHLYYLVSNAVKRGYSFFDHLRGEENYKTGWSNDSQYVNTMIVSNNSIMYAIKSNLLKIKNSPLLCHRK